MNDNKDTNVSEPELLKCNIAPRPLKYSLHDYHIAVSEGPLHYTWTDKPHRLVYDLIAAVKYYAKQSVIVEQSVSVSAEHVGEPVAYIRKDQLQQATQAALLCEVTPEPRQDRVGIYTTPFGFAVMQKPWVALTDEEVRQMCGSVPSMKEVVREAEAKLKAKNERKEKNT